MISGWIDEMLGSTSFNGTLSVDSKTPKISITTTSDFNPASLNTKISSGKRIEMNYNQAIENSWTRK